MCTEVSMSPLHIIHVGERPRQPFFFLDYMKKEHRLLAFWMLCILHPSADICQGDVCGRKGASVRAYHTGRETPWCSPSLSAGGLFVCTTRKL